MDGRATPRGRRRQAEQAEANGPTEVARAEETATAARTKPRANAPAKPKATRRKPKTTAMKPEIATRPGAAADRRGALSPEQWAEVRRLFEQGELSLALIGRSFNTHEQTIRRRATAEGWTVPPRRPAGEALGAAGRRALVARLFAAFERQVGEVEARDGAAGEGEVRVVAALAKTLETLIELDRAAGGGDEAGEIDGDALREEIARRLDRLGTA